MPEVIGDVDELISLIRRAATQTALDAEEEARRTREDLLAAAHKEADDLRAQAKADAKRKANAAHRRILAQAALDVQRQHLEQREALLERAWTEAETRLRALPDTAGYVDVLPRLAKDAAAALRTTTVLLAADAKGHPQLTPERLAAWGEATGVEFRCQPQPAAIWGGLVARDEAGRRVVDCSFAARLARAREELREQVADRLEIR